MRKQIQLAPESLIRLIRALQRSTQREKQAKFIAEGVRVCQEYRKGVMLITENFYADLKYQEFLNTKENQVPIYWCTSDIFKELASTETPQGCLMVIEEPKPINLHSWHPKTQQSLVVILDEVRDPGNVGTILRACWAFDVELLICLKGTVDPYNSKVVRSAMGAHAHIPIISSVEFANVQKHLLQVQYEMVTADSKGTLEPHNLQNFKRIALILSSEAHGHSSSVSTKLNVRIPMSSTCDSLNVAMAGSVLIWEIQKNNLHMK